MLRGFKRQLMLLLALAGLGVGSAVAEPLTKYTVMYGDAPAAPVRKGLKLAAVPQTVHNITFNVTGDEPFVVDVQDMDSAVVTVTLPDYYEYLGATVDGLDVIKDAEALWWDWIEVDVETLTFTFDQVVADHQVEIRCNPPKYVAMTGDDKNDGTIDRPFRTIQRGVNACNGAAGYVAVLPGEYEPFSCPNSQLHIIAQGPVEECVIDGGGTNRCATMGSAYGENAAELVGFTLRNGRAPGDGGGALYGCVVCCSILDCRAEGKGGGVSGAAVENTLIATCKAGGSGNLANASDLRNCTLRDSAETGVSIVDSTVRNCVATSEGGAQLLKGVTDFNHSVSNVTYAYPLRPATGRLLVGSPGLGAGDVSLVAAGETDLDGNPRLTTRGFATTVNCGCYESAVGTCTVRGTIWGANPWGTNEFHVAVGGDIPLPVGATVRWLSVNGKEVQPLPVAGGPFISGVAEGMTFETYITTKRYADAKNGDDANDGLTPETAKKTLQAAIDIAPGSTTDAADSVVLAAPGDYGPIVAGNRRMTVLGVEGAAKTIIDGGRESRCADLGGGNDNGLTNAVLRGFTVRNGRCDECGGGVRGGTVIACEITNNEADDYGGGVAFSTVRDSLIARNVNGCYESACGGACYGGSYFNCTIVGNSAPNGSGDDFSAGVYGAQELVNCVVQANRDEDGVERNTYGIARQVATVTSGADFADSARGDWRLTRYSPGVGTGDLSYVMDATDLDGFNRTTTNAEGKVTVNSGCYERTFPCLIHVTYTLFNPYDGTNEFREVDGNGPLVPRGYAVTELSVNGVSAAKLPQVDEPLVTGVRARTEVVVRFIATRYADAEHGDDAYDGLSPDRPKKTLQAAIDAAPYVTTAADSVVFAAPGVYTPITTANRRMAIVGTEGAARTIIDGGGKSRCANLSYVDYDTTPEKVSRTLLRGFTLRNGYVSQDGEEGAGVRGGTVVACVISGNKTSDRPGGGCAYSVVRESLIVSNEINCVTCLAGTGAYDCWLYNCTVVFNRAQNTRPSEGGYGVTGGRAVNCVVQSNMEGWRHEWNVDDDVEQTATTTSGAVFANAENGDFHLKPGSAGVATGDLKYVMDATDLDGAARVTVDEAGQRSINRGCYETIAWPKIRLSYTGVDPYGTNEFAAVNGVGPEVPRGSAVTELAVNGEPAAKLPQVGEPLVSGVTTDTEVVVRFIATRYADAANGDDANDGLSPDKAKRALQAAIDIAPNGRTAEDSVVFAAPGVYQPIATANRKLMILGAAGAGETVIDGGNTNRCADLGGKEFDGLTNTVLRGFSVLNGRCNKYGGGVRGGTVIACVIADNVADDFGGGVAYSTVRESLITRNVNNCDGTAWGGGCCYGNYFNCTIVGNSAPNGSGSGFSAGVFNADNLINCVVQGNYGKNGVEQNTRDIYHTVATVTNGAVFANAANGDYHLKPESPGVAAGDVAAVIDATDLEGAPRLTTDGAVTAAGAGKLPAGYVAAEYIESTPGGGQYIDTGYTPNKDTKVVFRLLDDGTGAYQSFGAAFGSRTGYLQERGMFLWLRYWDKNAPSYGRAGAEIGLEKSDFPFGDMTTVTCLGRECSWRNDDGTKTGRINLASNYNYDENQEAGFAPLFIFAMNSPSTPGGRNPTDCWGFRLYSFQIHEGSDVKHDFVPCVSDTGKAGLYDTVGQKFHGNAGGGQFKVGGVTVNCGCYETLRRFRIHVTYTGVDPYGTNEFLDVEGNGPVVPRGYAVTELAVDGEPAAKLPAIGEPLVSGVMADTEVVARFAAQRYADAANGDDANDGCSPDKPKKTLQAAIDVAPEAVSNAADSVVFAAPGTYAPIVCPNRRLSVIGTGGPDQVAIDAKNTSSRCATLRGSDSIGTNTVLSGVTLRNGNWNGSSDVVNGGGAYGGTLIGCVITNCCASQFGGGAACSALRNCLVARNRALAIFAQNPPGAGGYAVWCSNCTIADNAAPRTCTTYGLGLSVESGSMVVNSIVQGNTGLDGASGAQVWSPLDTKSTIEDGAKFVNAANGDYHLKPESAGIAAGDVASVRDATDLEGAARLTTNGLGQATVNCGCYETVEWAKVRLTYTGVDPYGVNEFAAVGRFGPLVPRGSAVTELMVDGVSAAKLPQVGEPLVSGVTADTEVVVRFTAQRYADAANGDDANDGCSPDKPKKTLQAAINVAPAATSNAADSIVFAAPGTYAPIATANRMLTIVGTEGAAKTIIDGGDTSRCADLSGDGTYTSVPTHTNTVLMGFTVRKGRVKHETGAGVRGGTVVACVVSTNVAESNNGAGCAYSVVRESLITGNLMPRDYSNPFGAGTFNCRLYNCTVVSNSTGNRDFSFGGCCGISGGFAVNCIVQGNRNASGEERNVDDAIDLISTVTNGAKFVDAANGDYHLMSDGAGVAAGNVGYVMDATDLEGAARLTTNAEGRVTVNCGCYETVKRVIRFVTIVDCGETYQIPYAWLETYGLAPNGSDYDVHYTSATNASANPVGPGATAVLPAWKSYVAGLDPTNAVEMFYSVITAPSNGWFRVGPNEVRTGRAYTVRETGVLRGAAVTNLWPIAEGRDAVDVEDNGTNSFFKVGVRVK